MKHTVEIWRAKVKPQENNDELLQQEIKPKRGRLQEPCLDYCAGTKRPKPSRTSYQKGKTPSLGTIAASASTNCCECCRVLAEYVKEVVRLVVLCPGNTKLAQLFCEMLDIGACLCNDCYYFIKKLLCCFFFVKKC